MNVKEKVGLLGVRPASAPQAETRNAPAPSPYEAAAAAAVTSAAASKADRQAAALQLWNKWATDALGPMGADPSPEELARKSRRVKRLENECAALAARAQHRLDTSHAIRATPVVLGGGGGGGWTGASEGGGASSSMVLRPGAFSREIQYAVREQRKAAAYAAVRAEGEAEAAAAAGADGAANAGGAAAYSPSFKSRAMLDALIASRAAGGAAAAPPPAPGASPAPGAASRPRPRSALPPRSISMSAGRIRPRSAVPGPAGAAAPSPTLGRQASMSPARASASSPTQMLPRNVSMAARAAALAGAGGGATAAAANTPGVGVVAVPEGEYQALRQEVDSVSERLAATQAALEVQADTEAQLREAVDLLRARLHSSGLREVDAQRRLAQHSKLEPLFDRLAECFTFSSPEEVVARLEFLEDDKLGTFDQLLRTQEEVTRLQQRLAEAQKAGETVATRLTTEHLQGSARLQEQNEELRQELESMETLVLKLTARQAQLVALQTAVLQLWGKLSNDPQFADAFTTPSGTTAVGGGGGAGATKGGRTQPGGANMSVHGGVVDDAAAAAAAPSDPLAMLHMIEEFVTAKSNKLAIRHFTDIQRMANNVWQQHFRNRAELRGRVVPTFEQLSKMAGRMADRVRSVQDRAGKSQEAEKHLMREVRRLQQQKRALEAALARRDEQFKAVMGVPRRSRPASASAELGHIMRREATSAATGGGVTASGMSFSGAAGGGGASAGIGGGGGPPVLRAGSTMMSAVSLSGALGASGVLGVSRATRSGELAADPSLSMASGVGMQLLRPPPHGSQFKSPSLQRRMRPVSAPNTGSGATSTAGGGAGGVGTSTSRLRQAMYGAMVGAGNGPAAAAPAVGAGGTLAAVLSPAIAGQVPQMVADVPMGAHWRQHVSGVSAAVAQRTAPSRLPGGSLYYVPGGGAAGAPAPAAAAGEEEDPAAEAEAGVAVTAELPSVRWSAPQRSAIEQAFLTRLERRTRVT